jgi:hypothetical protein
MVRIRTLPFSFTSALSALSVVEDPEIARLSTRSVFWGTVAVARRRTSRDELLARIS